MNLCEKVEVRDASESDLPVLEAMLFEAFFWRPEAERPEMSAFRSDAEFSKWLRDLGNRSGDRAVIAEEVDGGSARPIGAAFYRLFTDDEHSYGFIDESTPEIAIGVAAAARGRGVGHALLQALIERARNDGTRALSLSVEPDNYARQLYERVGFKKVGRVEGAWTMKFSLSHTLLALAPTAITTALLRSSLFLTLAVTLAVSTGCGGPLLAIPGGELSGRVETEPVSDWSFADDTFVDLEVRPSNPYSVELNYVVRDGQLYIDPAEGRQWFEYLREDLNVRVRFGGTVYPVTAVLVGKPGEHDGFEGLSDDRFIYRLDSRPGDSP